jgi:hypothetical protein
LAELSDERNWSGFTDSRKMSVDYVCNIKMKRALGIDLKMFENTPKME